MKLVEGRDTAKLRSRETKRKKQGAKKSDGRKMNDPYDRSQPPSGKGRFNKETVTGADSVATQRQSKTPSLSLGSEVRKVSPLKLIWNVILL